jgi:hypothetical protein
MKICFIISTCDKYLDNRVKFQMETMLKDFPTSDIYYLTSKPDVENRQFGYNCMDDEENITWKYIHFIYNMKIPEYDWYIFIHDDTFVFQDRLKNLLQNYNHSKCYYIGKECDDIKNEGCLYTSGGAGYAISNALYSQIYSYIYENGINNSYKHASIDLCIGLWIQEISKKDGISVKQLNNHLFHLDVHKSEAELLHAITFHKLMTLEQYQFYQSIREKETNNIFKKECKEDTTFALICDVAYWKKAKRTIIDLRSRGNWRGSIVLATIDFDLNDNFKDFYNVTEVKFPQIDKSNLLEKIGPNGFSNSDKRELNKVNQWEKLHIFDNYFRTWNRVIFLDAGLRILDDVLHLLALDYKNRILAPIDGKHSAYNEYNCQLSYDKPELISSLVSEFGNNILQSNFMLNCIWIYDTNILDVCDKNQLIEAMNSYPICKTNEMGIMNLLFHFKYHLWEPFPINSSIKNKFLFEWCELNNPGTNWRDYCAIKYPVTLSFGDI